MARNYKAKHSFWAFKMRGPYLALGVLLFPILIITIFANTEFKNTQNIQQEASYVAPAYYMYPITTSTCTAGTGWITVKKWGTNYCAPKCYDYGGNCYDTKKGIPSGYSYVGSGLCPGGYNIRCYRPTGNDTCSSTYSSGKCQADYKYCSGSYVSGKCPGESWYKCCTGGSSTSTSSYTRTCSRCSDTYRYCKATWKEGDSVCDRSKVIGSTTYVRDYSCTAGINRGYCP